MDTICYNPIGIIRSPFILPQGTPIQASASEEGKGEVIVFSEFTAGLKDLADFSHIMLIYHFHKAKKGKLLVKPFLDNQEHGIFATRAPGRPNPIGLSVVRLLEIKENILTVTNLDILDKTPLLDIKPYVPGFDIYQTDKNGWLESNIDRLPETCDDGRFIEE